MYRMLFLAVILLAPTLVSAQNARPFGDDYDDYLCHDVTKSDWIEPEFNNLLNDQFGKTDSVGLKAAWICNPTSKEVSIERDRLFDSGIRNPELHYMCYMLEVRSTSGGDSKFAVLNEYEDGAQYETQRPRMLCVPSVKRHFR